MKTLPLQIVRAGLVWQQVARTADKAIYAGSIGGKVVEWEIIKIRVREPESIRGSAELPKREVYPSSSEWGLYGWTINNEHRALNKYNQL